MPTDDLIATQGGNLLLGKLLEQTNLEDRINLLQRTFFPPPFDIPTIDVVKAYIGTLAQAQPAFEAIEQFRYDPYFQRTLNIDIVPSCSTVRQRLDMIGEIAKAEMNVLIMQESCNLLRTMGTQVTPCFADYVPLDVDVSPFDNSRTKKEGIGFTYKKVFGYAPIIAYLGQEGFCVNVELREGTQHCQKNTPEFLEIAIKNAKLATDAKILVRLDSGNDSSDNMALFQRLGVDFIIKRNPRQEDIEAHFHKAVESGIEIPGSREGKRIFVYESAKKPKGCSKDVR